MGKKFRQPSTKSTKREHKQQTHNPKILRPKVYITQSSNFKNLVQQLTGNGNSPVSSPPLLQPPTAASAPPTWLPFVDYAYQENSLDLSFDSSCFSTPLEGSPDLRHGMETSHKIDFSIQDLDLEALLMGVDNSYESCFGVITQEICVYDHDLCSLI